MLCNLGSYYAQWLLVLGTSDASHKNLFAFQKKLQLVWCYCSPYYLSWHVSKTRDSSIFFFFCNQWKESWMIYMTMLEIKNFCENNPYLPPKYCYEQRWLFSQGALSLTSFFFIVKLMNPSLLLWGVSISVANRI